jgi:hypothetical protein
MSESKPKTPPEEIAVLLKHSSLQLDVEQFEALCSSYDEFEAAARRLRKGVERNDEPAFAFRVPKQGPQYTKP